ncbi:MAG: SNF2-related protein [Chitinophagaceae bacterium]
MALPYLLKHVYTHGSDEVIRRGKKIHLTGLVELAEHDYLFAAVTFRVKDDSYSTFYKVYIQNYKDPKSLSLRCSCPYNLGDICRHEAAALMRLQEMIDKGMLQENEVLYDQQHTVAKMRAIEIKTIRLLCDTETFTGAEDYLRNNAPQIEAAKDETVKASVNINNVSYKVIIRRNEERTFDTSSDYVDTEHPLCLPKVIVFLHLFNRKGAHYFDSIRNWDKEKNKLLEVYGFSLNDDLNGKFEFNYKEGKPFLRVLDSSIKRITVSSASVFDKAEKEVAEAEAEVEIERPVLEGKHLGIVFNLNKKSFPFFFIELVEGEMSDEHSFAGKVQKLELAKYIDIENYTEKEKNLITQVRKLQDSEIDKYINRNSPFSGFWENIVQNEADDPPEETKQLITEYIIPRLKKLSIEFADVPFFVLPTGQSFITANLQKTEFSHTLLSPQFFVSKKEKKYEVECFIRPDAVAYGLNDNEAATSSFFLYNHQIFLWANTEAASVAAQFLPEGTMNLSEETWPGTLDKIVLPLTKQYKVEFDNNLVDEVKDGIPETRLYLHEKGDYLVFSPVFNYKGFDTKAKDRDQLVVPYGGKVILVNRNRDVEQAFIEKLRTLHSNFMNYDDGAALALKGIEVLKNNWFFLFVDAMKEEDVQIFGFDSLKNFRFNTAKPSTHIYISSNTDWFDAKVDILFGDQYVSVAEVKRALANKQQFVQLNDGTLGILPEEWLKKYGLLFRVGEGKTDKLKLSRYHFSVIDELYENRNEEELTIQLEEKYDKIREFNNIKEIAPPEHLQSILRPYQVAGYQWLNYLHEVSWGGILADDMGLGKTVQALSFLKHYLDEYGELKSLVVCPTTLIYNWENEIKKFCPTLTYYIHHGPQRLRQPLELQKHNIIITTYGTLRSDIKVFTQIMLDYVVLDESQAIKNPSSKVTKAAALLKAKTSLVYERNSSSK